MRREPSRPGVWVTAMVSMSARSEGLSDASNGVLSRARLSSQGAVAAVGLKVGAWHAPLPHAPLEASDKLAPSRACSITGRMTSMWERAAISGTTPPYAWWRSI